MAAGPHPDSGFIAPSLDVTAWFHDFDPASEWLLVRQTSPRAKSGLMGTVGSVFSASGKLLASGGTQLLCAAAPSSPSAQSSK